MDLSALPVVYRTRVAERHLDRFGHVNVMWYTHFIDEATLSLFDRFGCGTAYLEESGNGMFALEEHTRYLRELRLGDGVETRARILGRSAKRIHFMLFLREPDHSEPSATSELLGMHIDLSRRRSSPFPEAVAESIDALLEEHRQLLWEAPVCGVMGP
jgi:acyl-CoA thioester hydrolase